jgi:HEAT repeat protein
MNKNFLSSFVVGSILCASFNAYAAIPSMSDAKELINLPSANRKMLIEGPAGSKFYSHFSGVAFDAKQAMPTRWQAIMAMGETRHKNAVKDLQKASEQSEWFMRNAALVAMQENYPSEAQKLALNLLKDKALVVRSAAVDTLRRNATPEVRDILWEELNQGYNYKKKRSLWIRAQIVEVLAQAPSQREMRLFADLLSDKDQRLQIPAIAGLEKITGQRLGGGKTVRQKEMVGLWQQYLKKNL